jgi:hypothetical protein
VCRRGSQGRCERRTRRLPCDATSVVIVQRN